MFISNITADPEEVLFDHPRHGEWTRSGFVKLINGMADPRGNMHPRILIGFTPKQIIQAFCEGIKLDINQLKSALTNGSQKLSDEELHKIIVATSLYMKSNSKDNDGLEEVKFQSRGGRNLRFLGEESDELQRLLTQTYDANLCVIHPEFKSDNLRRQLSLAKEKAVSLGEEFVSHFFEPEVIGQLIFLKMNQYSDWAEEYDPTAVAHLADIREMYLPGPVMDEAIGALESKKGLNNLGKLIAGAVVEFIDAFVSAAKSDPDYKFDPENPINFSLDQEAELQQRLFKCNWFLTLTDYQFVQSDREWASKLEPSALLVQPRGSGRQLHGGLQGGLKS